MTVGRDIENAVDGAVARIREAAESEIRDLVQMLAADAESAVAAHDAAIAQVRGEAAEREAVIARAAEAEAVAVGRQSARSAVARLLEAVQRLDAQTTLIGVLDTLADVAAADAGRAALFVATGGEMRGWRFVGFGPEVGAAREHIVNGAVGGLLGRAIAERRTQILAAGGEGAASDAGEPPAFAALPAGRGAVAVPVLVGGEPMVAVYADDATTASDGDAADASSHLHWTGVVELLARHAGCRLEALTANRAAEMAGDTE